MLQRIKPDAPFVLFQRDTSNWSMRYSLDGRQIRKSLGTPDRDEAHRRANKIWHEQSYRLSQGLSIQDHAFCDVAEEFIRKIEGEVERKERSDDHATYWPAKIRRFFVGFFGKKQIDRITSADIERYLEWRKTYWTSGPGSEIDRIEWVRADGRTSGRPAPRKIASVSTMRGEMVILRGLFQQADRWGYAKSIDMPGVTTRRRSDNRRPSFTTDEYFKLAATALDRIYQHDTHLKQIAARDGRTWTQKKIRANLTSDRAKLYSYIEIMANSGMRPTEAKNLCWGNILNFRNSISKPSIQRDDVRLQVHGKGMHGIAVPLPGVIPALQLLWERFQDEVGRDPDDEDPVFADSAGNRIISFKKGFAELLKAADLERDHRGIKRTPYSLRHYYISSLIAQGVSVHDVARNTRTSLEMIDKHYAQVSTEQIKDKLRPKTFAFDQPPSD